MTDPLWDDFRHRLTPFGLRAVWARPLLSSEGKILGTFASYYREVRSPSPTDLQLIENASHIAGIAIERHMYEEHCHAARHFSLKPSAQLDRQLLLENGGGRNHVVGRGLSHLRARSRCATDDRTDRESNPPGRSTGIQRAGRAIPPGRQRCGVRVPAGVVGPLGQVPAPRSACQAKRRRALGVCRRDSGYHAAPPVGAGAQQGPIGARPRGQGDEPGPLDGIDRP